MRNFPFDRHAFRTVLIVVTGILLSAKPSAAATLYVGNQPGDFATISAAVNAATTGDDVVVRAGVYTGPSNTNINPAGKAIAIRGITGNPSDITIQGAANTRGFVFISGETPSTHLRDLTVTGCSVGKYGATDLGGAAVLITKGSSPTITNCRFINNTTSATGGAIAIGSTGQSGSGASTPLIDSCTFDGNKATTIFSSLIERSGGAISVLQLDTIDDGPADVVKIQNCTFQNNESDFHGGAIVIRGHIGFTFYPVNVEVSSCTFSDNGCQAGSGGAIHVLGGNLSVSGSSTVFAVNAARTFGGAVSCYGRNVDIADATFISNSVGIGPSTPSCPADPLYQLRCGGAIGIPSIYQSYTDTQMRNITVRSCTIQSNHAEGAGGGFAASSPNHPPAAFQKFVNLTIESNYFYENDSSRGGAIDIFLHGVSSGPFPAQHIVRDNVIESNHATPYLPMYFEGRHGGGGGIHMYGAGLQGEFVQLIERNTIVRNTTTAFGGGVCFEDKGNLIFRNNFVEANGADFGDLEANVSTYCEQSTCANWWCDYTSVPRWNVTRGGGLFAVGGAGVSIIGNYFYDNYARSYPGEGGYGGGLALRVTRYFDNGWIGDSYVVKNNVFVENVAESEGGGVHLELYDTFPEEAIVQRLRGSSDASVELVNNSVSCNAAPAGDGIYVYKEIPEGRVHNNISWDNEQDDIDGIVGSPDNAKYEYNDVGVWGSWFATIPANNVQIAPGYEITGCEDQWSPGGDCGANLGYDSAVRDAGNPADVDCDPDRVANDLGAFGGGELCELGPWVVQGAWSTFGCNVTYTWNTTMAASTGHFTARGSNSDLLEPAVISNTPTSHYVTFPAGAGVTYDIEITATNEELRPTCTYYDRLIAPTCAGGDTPGLERGGGGASVNARGSEMMLEVYDASGCVVRTVDGLHRGDPAGRFRWDHRNNRGSLVPSGVYFVVMKEREAGGRRLAGSRVVIVR